MPTSTKANNWPDKWGHKTSVMGVINITPDSFSDGGEFYSLNNALIQVEKNIQAGADIIDLGAQSTRPGAIEVGPEEEINRLLPVLKEIRNCYPKIIISVDTFHSEVAYESLTSGASWINDVTGGRRDTTIIDAVSEFNCPFVITHSRGNSTNMNSLIKYNNLISDIIASLNLLTENAINKNINRENIIWDPGLGFSKNTLQNIEILKNLKEFQKYQYPILIGASRKRFIGDILNESDPKRRDIGSLAVAGICSQLKIEAIRVHNVQIHREFLDVLEGIYE